MINVMDRFSWYMHVAGFSGAAGVIAQFLAVVR